LKTALQGTPVDILSSLRVEKFDEIHQDRLQRADKLFHGQ